MQKILFMIFLMIGTLISISSSSYIGMWMGLEINLLSFIPLMKNNKNIINNEAMIKYFIVQSLASAILLFSILLMYTMKENFMIMMNTALMLKMAMAPLHFWIIQVIEGLSWLNILILLTWQKIAPLILLTYNNLNILMMIFIIISIIFSSIQGFIQNNLQKILVFSSINHLSWIFSNIMMKTNFWFYFITYSVTMIPMIWIINKLNINNLNQLNFKLNFNMKIIFLLNFFNLVGIPPFIMFFPKWLIIQQLMFNNLNMLTFILIIFTLLNMFMYLRILMTNLLLKFSLIKIWNFKMNSNLMFFFTLNFLYLILIYSLIFNYM